ncbi:hypothetical protein TSOC_001345 [Tetrabaena socialis]|uniref:Uncharacterized protein n=1 Tax=Tetrabaena socialis TaxID=47790 RepID=A0A2J8AGY7_9CHLO|nr:hypothetical protein TSOC_001345 [Tetrabaena socialis]|eukprot:PNH11756.1 hypothetical protein TSOC_001345 [Tetrabaena socialis]
MAAAISSVWFRLAAVSGSTAIGLGAYGAHGFKPQASASELWGPHRARCSAIHAVAICSPPCAQDPYYAEVFRRANSYHLIHSLLLAIAPSTRRPWLVGGLTLLGMGLFSGSCYAVALQQDKAWARAAPISQAGTAAAAPAAASPAVAPAPPAAALAVLARLKQE